MLHAAPGSDAIVQGKGCGFSAGCLATDAGNGNARPGYPNSTGCDATGYGCGGGAMANPSATCYAGYGGRGAIRITY